MEHKTVTSKQYILKLTPAEAEILKGLVQNPVNLSEPIEESNLREQLFEALSK